AEQGLRALFLKRLDIDEDRQLLAASLGPLLQGREGSPLLEVLEVDGLVQKAHQRLGFADARAGVLLSRGFEVHATANSKSHEPKCQLPVHVRSPGNVSWTATQGNPSFPPNSKLTCRGGSGSVNPETT